MLIFHLWRGGLDHWVLSLRACVGANRRKEDFRADYVLHYGLI